jgi:WD40 repeat protein
VKDLFVRSSFASLRVVTCSLDRSVVVFDVHAGRQCLRVSLPQSLESLTCNPTSDFAFAGSSGGEIYIVDLTAGAIGVSASQAQVRLLCSTSAVSGMPATGAGAAASGSQRGLGGGADFPASGAAVPSLQGHSRSVTALRCSADNTTLISASEDGSLRWWDFWTRQCLRETKPLNKTGLTNAVVSRRIYYN